MIEKLIQDMEEQRQKAHDTEQQAIGALAVLQHLLFLQKTPAPATEDRHTDLEELLDSAGLRLAE